MTLDSRYETTDPGGALAGGENACRWTMVRKCTGRTGTSQGRRDMAQAMTTTTNKPAWVDLASADAEASRDFYSKLLGWQVEVNPDPQYGGYGLAKTGGLDAAGIGPKMDPNGPTAW